MKVYVVSYADDGCEPHHFVFDNEWQAKQCEGWCMGNFDSTSYEECDLLQVFPWEEAVRLTEDYFS